MNTLKISHAQLSVSKCYTVDTINTLINIIGRDGLISYYNFETKSIDIEHENNKEIDINIIKYRLKEWLDTLTADKESIEILKNNIDFIFNITRLNSPDGTIFKVYLY